MSVCIGVYECVIVVKGDVAASEGNSSSGSKERKKNS